MHAVLKARTVEFGLVQMARWTAPLLVVFALVLGGCEMSETQERTAKGVGAGAAVGAAGGALFGAMAGSPGMGAAIGAGVGAAAGGVGGYVYDQHEKRKDSDAENEQLRRENEELRKQQNQ